MSVEANLALVRRYQEIYNTNQMSTLGEVLAPNFQPHNLMPGVPNSLEGIQGLHAMTVAAYPDFHVNIEDLFGAADRVVMRFIMTGTHRGNFMGVPPTGKKIHVTGISIFRIAEGKIVEHWGEEDSLGWMQQIGAIPSF